MHPWSVPVEPSSYTGSTAETLGAFHWMGHREIRFELWPTT